MDTRFKFSVAFAFFTVPFTAGFDAVLPHWILLFPVFTAEMLLPPFGRYEALHPIQPTYICLVKFLIVPVVASFLAFAGSCIAVRRGMCPYGAMAGFITALLAAVIPAVFMVAPAYVLTPKIWLSSGINPVFLLVYILSLCLTSIAALLGTACFNFLISFFELFLTRKSN